MHIGSVHDRHRPTLHGIAAFRYDAVMSEITIANGRDERTGRFLAGNSGNGGRRPGARGKLGEQFLSDLRDVWQTHGIQALEKCAEEEPGTFVRVIASLLPRAVDLNMTLDAASFARTFQEAIQLLGNEPSRHRPPLPGQRTLKHER